MSNGQGEKMQKIIDLLTEKNNCLQKFFYINEQELLNFMDGSFENVEVFYNTRDHLLEIVRVIDKHIDKHLAEENQTPGSEALIPGAIRQRVEAAMREKDALVKAILAQDIQILSLIEKEKNQIIKDLQAVKKSRRIAGAYSQPDLEKHFDEKA